MTAEPRHPVDEIRSWFPQDHPASAAQQRKQALADTLRELIADVLMLDSAAIGERGFDEAHALLDAARAIHALVFGLLLAGSSAKLSSAIGADPIGALTQLLPTWFLVPFAIVAVLGLVGGAVLDIYSSGLALLTVGLPAPRFVAALIDGEATVSAIVCLACA